MKTKTDLLKALNTEDDLGKVIRAHIVIESLLNQIIEMNINEKNYLEKAELTYIQKVNLALAFGCSNNWESALRTIGTIRNGFAHKARGELTKSDVNNLYKSFHRVDKERAQEIFNNNKEELKSYGYNSFSTLTPSHKFALCICVMCGALQAHYNHYNQA